MRTGVAAPPPPSNPPLGGMPRASDSPEVRAAKIIAASLENVAAAIRHLADVAAKGGQP